MKTSTAQSSHGSITFNAKTGQVISENLCGCPDCPTNIGTFDVEEYKRHYNVSELPADIDILDLGYWLEDESYEEPAHDWREETKLYREGGLLVEKEEKYEVPIRTVEELFDIDADDNDQQVILVSDLTEHQKRFLGIIS